MGGFRTRAGLEPAPTVDGTCDRSHCHTGDAANEGGEWVRLGSHAVHCFGFAIT
ncbi:MAG: hypothetical protein KatS3mg054_0683 [Chloroflexus sp.]|nr:MAG: hypothetical protein KatS3mg054_0683 [Chloroflexus sp.]